MEFKEIEKELRDIEHSKRYLENLAKSIEYYKSKLESAPVGNLSDIPIAGGNSREDALAEFVDLKNVYENLLIKTLAREGRIYRIIARLDFAEQNILIEKYIHNQTWLTVSESQHYSIGTLKRKANAALKKLTAFLDGQND